MTETEQMAVFLQAAEDKGSGRRQAGCARRAERTSPSTLGRIRRTEGFRFGEARKRAHSRPANSILLNENRLFQKEMTHISFF